MLVLTQKLHDRIRIDVGGVTVWVSVVRLGAQVRLGFEAPASVEITRNDALPVQQQYPDGVEVPVILETMRDR